MSPGPENDAGAACNEIKTALHALADSEHAESLALDLASGGGNSTAIVEARLSVLLDRTQDLRVALKHVRQSAVARDPMVDQCTRMGFRALVISEKLSSDVESVLFGGERFCRGGARAQAWRARRISACSATLTLRAALRGTNTAAIARISRAACAPSD